MSDSLGVIRLSDRPVVDFGGGATYRAIISDDTGPDLPIRTGVQVSPPGYQTRIHSHPYVETLTVLEGIGEVWLDDRERFARYLRPDELHGAFNFDFLACPWDAEALRSCIDDTMRSHAPVDAFKETTTAAVNKLR